MDDESFRIAELLLQGYTCGHVLAKLALEAQGRDDPDLVRAMSGLALGMGRGLNCGALSGGCCILGLYGGRANDDEQVHPRYDLMIEQFSAWFVDAMAKTIWRRQLPGDHQFRSQADAAALSRPDPRVLAQDQGDPRRAPNRRRRTGSRGVGGELNAWLSSPPAIPPQRRPRSFSPPASRRAWARSSRCCRSASDTVVAHVVANLRAAGVRAHPCRHRLRGGELWRRS